MRYVQYGCGLDAPDKWINYDASPTLRMQRLPFVGQLIRRRSGTKFPRNVLYGDIVKGLPEAKNSCDGLYCSHVLEHLSLQDFRQALQNSLVILKPGATFRIVVPDLKLAAERYLMELRSGNTEASNYLLDNGISLGRKSRSKGLKKTIISMFGNSHHLWMWDELSLKNELDQVGFKNIRHCKFGDSKDIMFSYVENEARFSDSVSIECMAPGT